MWLLYSIFFCSVAFFLFQWWHEEEWQYGVAWLLLLAAAGSNILERFSYGCVFDFLTLSVGPLFNGADVILTLGVVFLLWRELRR